MSRLPDAQMVKLTYAQRQDPRYVKYSGRHGENVPISRPMPTEELEHDRRRWEFMIEAAEDPNSVVPTEIADAARECQELKQAASEAIHRFSEVDYTADQIENLRSLDYEANINREPATHYEDWVTEFETRWFAAKESCDQYRYASERFIRASDRDDETGYRRMIEAAVAGPEAKAQQELADALAKAERSAAKLTHLQGTREWIANAAQKRYLDIRPLGEHPRCPEHEAILQAQASLPAPKAAAKPAAK